MGSAKARKREGEKARRRESARACGESAAREKLQRACGFLAKAKAKAKAKARANVLVGATMEFHTVYRKKIVPNGSWKARLVGFGNAASKLRCVVPSEGGVPAGRGG
jgi:hypothetical protein